MSIYGKIVKHIFNPLWKLKAGNLVQIKYNAAFEEMKSLPLSEIVVRQNQRLKDMVGFAYDNSVYYKKLFDLHGVVPKEVNSIEDLSDLPLFTKDIARQYYSEIKSSAFNEDQLFSASTGGSTGKPMKFVRDQECVYQRIAQDRFFDKLYLNYDVGDKMAYFVSASHHVEVTSKLKRWFKNATCDRTLAFDPSNITNEYLKEFTSEYLKFKPKVIKCFPNSLTIFAKYIKDNNISLPPVESISCTGETLYIKQRELFEEVFGGKVFEKYGSKECGVACCECSQHDGMHLFSESAIVELLSEDGKPVSDGETGRVVITDLFNRGFPLIRYDIGDLAVAYPIDEQCSCGSQFPRLKKLLGRDRDILFDHLGNPKPGYLFVNIIDKLELDAQFQVHQHESRDVTVRIANKKIQQQDLEKIKKEYLRILGGDITVTVDYVDGIARDKSGKYRYVKNDVSLMDGMN